MSETHDAESDSRQKLEADVEHMVETCGVRWLRTYIIEWLDRQAALTASVYNKLARRRRQENEREFVQLERDRYEWQRRWQAEDEAHYHQRKATAEMVEEMWRALQNSVELPKDADGEYIRLGSYVERDFGKCHVLAVSREFIVVDVSMSDGHEDDEPWLVMYLASNFRRYAPRDKDGQPIRRGDVVYGGDGIEFTVTGIAKNKKHCVVGQMADGHCKWLRPEWLTHDKSKTVTDILKGLWSEAVKYAKSDIWRDPEEAINECADKLQLKED